jgi:hypothetical protein
LVGWAESQVTDGIAVLIAFLLEVLSGLGFTFAALAGRRGADARSPGKHPEHGETAKKTRKPRPAVAQDAKRNDIALIDAPADDVGRWTLARLDVLSSGRIQAAAAYQDFAAWCKTEGIEPCTLQMFGRLLTGIVEGMGGRKLKVNGRAYYQGVALQERPARTGQRKKIAVS